MQIELHVKRTAIVVKFWNQVNAVDGPPGATERYVRPAMDAVTKTHQYGTPELPHFRKNRGACLFWARAKRYRDPVYKKALADEEAEVRMTALMIEGKIGIPALVIPITHGDWAAPGLLSACAESRFGSLEDTRTPTARDPRT